MPALRSQGRDHVDLALVTHGHSDHVVGVIELMSLGRVDSLLLPQMAEKEDDTIGGAPASEHNPFDQKAFDWTSLILKSAAE